MGKHFFDEYMSCYRLHESGFFSHNEPLSKLWHLKWHILQLIEWPEHRKIINERIYSRCIYWLVGNLDRDNIKHF